MTRRPAEAKSSRWQDLRWATRSIRPFGGTSLVAQPPDSQIMTNLAARRRPTVPEQRPPRLAFVAQSNGFPGLHQGRQRGPCRGRS